MDGGALAVLAGNSLVTAVVTDAWEGVRHKVAAWFGRGEPDPKTLGRLDRTHAELAAAPPGEVERVRQDLAREWAGRFKDLIADYPDAAGELDGLVRQIQASTAAASIMGSPRAGTRPSRPAPAGWPSARSMGT